MLAMSENSSAITQTWQSIQTEALVMSQREAFLAPVLKRSIQEPQCLADALARRIADVLALHDKRREDLEILLSDLLRNAPSIASDATRDLHAIHTNDPACPTKAHAFLNYKGFQAVQAHRLAHLLWTADRKELAMWLSNRVSVALGPDIHPAAQLGAGIMLDHGSGIVIGETAVIEDDVSILQNVTLGGTGKTTGDRHPKIRRGVFVGAGANVIGNIEIGEGSKIAAGSVVLKDVPPGCTVAGIPAQIVRLHLPKQTWSATEPQTSGQGHSSEMGFDGLQSN